MVLELSTLKTKEKDPRETERAKKPKSRMGQTDQAERLRKKVKKKSTDSFKKAGGTGDLESAAISKNNKSDKVMSDYDSDMNLIDSLGTQAQRAKGFGTPARNAKRGGVDSPTAVTEERIKIPGGGNNYETITTKKNLQKGGTVRLASGGPVVDSYDYD